MRPRVSCLDFALAAFALLGLVVGALVVLVTLGDASNAGREIWVHHRIPGDAGSAFLGPAAGAILLATFIALLHLQTKSWLARRRLGDVALSIEPRELATGGALRVEVKIVPGGELDLEGGLVELLCERRSLVNGGLDLTTFKKHSRFVELEVPRETKPGREVAIAASLVLDPDAPPSGRDERHETRWLVKVKVEITGSLPWEEARGVVVRGTAPPPPS